MNLIETFKKQINDQIIKKVKSTKNILDLPFTDLSQLDDIKCNLEDLELNNAEFQHEYPAITSSIMNETSGVALWRMIMSLDTIYNFYDGATSINDVLDDFEFYLSPKI